MIVGVLGAGAIGTLLGATLAGRCEVRMLVRDNRVARTIANRGGLVLDDAEPRRVKVSPEPGSLDGCDLLLVALKTYAVPSVLGRFRASAAARVPIVSFSNGAGAVEAIEYALGHHACTALAPTTEAVLGTEPGIARRTGRGTTRLGWAHDHAGDDAVLDALLRALGTDLEIERVQPIEPFVWGKLIANAAINPLTALAGIENGALLERPALRERAARIAREGAEVARARGIVLPFDDPVSYIEGVARATSANRSSMLVDLQAGRPTEIDAINGAIVRDAAGLGVPVPENLAALDEVRALRRA